MAGNTLCGMSASAKKIAKREKKHALGFDFKRVAAYGKAPDKRAIHHNNRGKNEEVER